MGLGRHAPVLHEGINPFYNFLTELTLRIERDVYSGFLG